MTRNNGLYTDVTRSKRHMTGQFEHIPRHGCCLGLKEFATNSVRNFAERGELGAACAIYLHGEKVVDHGVAW